VLIALLVAGTMVGCKKALQVAKKVFPAQEFSLPEVVVDVPVNPYAPPLFPSIEVPLDTITQRLDMDSIVKKNTGDNFGAADISSVTLQDITFTIKQGADNANNFSNFESARFTLSSASNMNAVEVANITFPNTYSDSIHYTPPVPVELRSYLDAKELKYVVYGKARKVTTKPLKMAINARMRMK
jgi:hypothetical protein